MTYEDNSIPRGSPLGPFGPARSPRGLPMPPPGTFSPTFAPVGDYEDAIPPQAFDKPGMNLPLPKAPPSAMRRSTPWDREHISETLLGMGAGFLSSRNFVDGLGNAAQAVMGRNNDIRAERAKAVSYGGPDNQFEITRDADGNLTYREVPEFRTAADRQNATKIALAQATAQAKQGLTPKDQLEFRARALFSISQLPPDQRQEAYQRLISNPEQYGIDASQMPATWDDLYGTIGGNLGLNVNQSMTQDRGRAAAAERVRHNLVGEGQRDRALQQGAARVAQGAARLAKTGTASSKGFSAPKSKADFDALPRGAKFMAPDGSLRIKQ